jgi:CheY-like chemotaxis protein/anti-sigma regulatory factor (Ser/Thr protein kinase)
VRRVALECRNDAAGVLVAADADRLQQIVSNLVSNALKFTEGGGHVTVSLARAGSQLEIAVQDDGAGIEPQFLPHVFEPFAQAEGAGVRTHQGLGLGLSIVKSLVALHGGTISAASEGPGKGSRFAVCLPVAAIVASGSPEERAADARLSLRGLTVLVVDDAADARNLVQAALQEHGAEVVLADSAAAAMTALDAGHIDVLVADIGMPYEDGYALIRNVRQHARHHDLPALALTAHGSEEDRRRIAGAGYQGYQIKPAPLPALVGEIRALAQRA